MFSRSGGSLKIEDDKHVFQAMVIEAAGSFFFITIFLINTELNSRFFHEPGFRLLVIAAAYVWAIELSRKLAGGSINPAFGLCVNITMFMDTGKGEELKWIWLYIFLPFSGSILALIFHEFIFKKSQEGIDEIQRSQSRNDDISYHPPSVANE